MQLFRSPSHSVPPGGWLGALGASPAPRLGVLALALTACDGDPMRIAARQTACCCDHCPTSAAPAASRYKVVASTETSFAISTLAADRTRSPIPSPIQEGNRWNR